MDFWELNGCLLVHDCLRVELFFECSRILTIVIRRNITIHSNTIFSLWFS